MIERVRLGTERSTDQRWTKGLAVAQNGTSVAFVRSTRGIEPDVRKSDSTIQSRRSGATNDRRRQHSACRLCVPSAGAIGGGLSAEYDYASAASTPSISPLQPSVNSPNDFPPS